MRVRISGVTLTPAGKHLYARAVLLLAEAEELELSASSGGLELAGPLVIALVALLLTAAGVQALRHRDLVTH